MFGYLRGLLWLCPFKSVIIGVYLISEIGITISAKLGGRKLEDLACAIGSEWRN